MKNVLVCCHFIRTINTIKCRQPYKQVGFRDSIQGRGRVSPVGCISLVYFNESVSAGYLSPESQKDLRAATNT